MNKVVIGVIGDDIHETGNKVIAELLEHEGFSVVNLGVQVKPAAFVEASADKEVVAIIISSLYGKAKEDCQALMQSFRGVQYFLPPLYLGGCLRYPEESWRETEEYFLNLGFCRVYRPGTPIETTIKDLKKDLMLS